MSTPTSGGARLALTLSALTALAILAQAIIAGQFVSQDGKTGWIDAHNAAAYIVSALALVTTIGSWRTLRHQAPSLWRTAAVLFVLVIAQTGIGHAITDNGSDWLIGVHVPLAVIIYGVAVRLSIQTATHVRNRPHSARRFPDAPIPELKRTRPFASTGRPVPRPFEPSATNVAE